MLEDATFTRTNEKRFHSEQRESSFFLKPNLHAYTIVAASKIKLAAFRRFLPSLREPLLATPWILLCDFVLRNESFIDLDDICNIAPFLLQCFLGLS